MSKYWDIHKILPYQRNFNFINGERSIGKSYTTQKFLIKEALFKGREFVYIVRTQYEKKRGVLTEAFAKVVANEYGSYRFEGNSEEYYQCIENDETGKDDKLLLGHCIALSEYMKIKKLSFPNVKYIIFDEYMLEDKNSSCYFRGSKEPDAFLNIYHTIDREEDRVVCFCLGNNTSFYNPYHMHPAFKIPKINKGEIWYSKNVLFQWAESSDELTADKNKSKFLEMIKDTEYANYAVKGEYIYDNNSLIMERTEKARLIFNVSYFSHTYGIWSDTGIGRIFVDDKYNPTHPLTLALTLNDHTENTMLTKGWQLTHIKWLAKNFKLGNVRYVSMEVKSKTEEMFYLIV